MSDDIAIRVKKLGKRYKLGQQTSGYKTLGETITRAVKSPFQHLQHEELEEKKEAGTFWALKDISFEVKKGEVLGIIGKNGAGKSTLLKILSRITAPTEGTVEINGRVGSLLEVGTGFHPELTGRENVFLSGSIMGMKKAEIEEKFDQIVNFAEIEKFLDTPVKRYSSGMYVRLAFAVAAHLEPEILIVDEVLAVGDAEFQKKCLGKMGDVASEGRTVLFVSHNLGAVQNLCQKGIVLEHGMVKFIGSVPDSIATYQMSYANSAGSLEDRTDRMGSGEIRVTAIELRNLNGHIIDTVSCDDTFDVFLYYKVKPGFENCKPIVSISVKTPLEVPIFLIHNRMTGDILEKLPQKGAFVCRISNLPLVPSSYKLDYSVMNSGNFIDGLNAAADLDVTSGDIYGTGEVPPPSHGLCFVKGHWRVSK
jgi:lipopolysaccharide transport system ATP-binding protein